MDDKLSENDLLLLAREVACDKFHAVHARYGAGTGDAFFAGWDAVMEFVRQRQESESLASSLISNVEPEG